jgi:hypothetical protein
MRDWAKGMHFQQSALELPHLPSAWPALVIDVTYTDNFSTEEVFLISICFVSHLVMQCTYAC